MWILIIRIVLQVNQNQTKFQKREDLRNLWGANRHDAYYLAHSWNLDLERVRKFLQVKRSKFLTHKIILGMSSTAMAQDAGWSTVPVPFPCMANRAVLFRARADYFWSSARFWHCFCWKKNDFCDRFTIFFKKRMFHDWNRYFKSLFPLQLLNLLFIWNFYQMHSLFLALAVFSLNFDRAQNRARAAVFGTVDHPERGGNNAYF